MKRQKLGARQGDVLLVPVQEAPAAGIPISPVEKNGRSRYILAEGEKTGHHHSVPANAHVAFMTDGGFRRFLSVEGRTHVSHQEHRKLALQGDYEVITQREIYPSSEFSIFPVVD